MTAHALILSFVAFTPLHCTPFFADQERPSTETDWAEPTSTLNLVNCVAVTTDEFGDYGVKGRLLDDVFERENCFQIRTLEAKTDERAVLTLCAPSEIELEEWLQAVDLACSLGMLSFWGHHDCPRRPVATDCVP